jgi:ribosomal protein S18 acetylase RimI-like enzyme
MNLEIKAMKVEDIDDVLRIQSDAYQELDPETKDVLLRKISKSPDTCWLACVNNTTIGYLICHPWNKNLLPTLNSEDFDLPENPDLFYVHDLSVSKNGRGLGVGNALVKVALEYAKALKFEEAALVAVQNSMSFWKKFGFLEKKAANHQMQLKLQEYGSNATYMKCQL